MDYFSGFPGCKEHWKRWKWLENFKSWQTSSSTRKFLLWFRWTIFCFLIWQLPATFIHRSVASSKKDEWKIAGEAQWKFIGKGICPGRGRIKYLWGAEHGFHDLRLQLFSQNIRQTSSKIMWKQLLSKRFKFTCSARKTSRKVQADRFDPKPTHNFRRIRLDLPQAQKELRKWLTNIAEISP